jgi:hypothetical protein
MAKIRFVEIVHPRLFGVPAVDVHATALNSTRLGAADLPQAHATMSRAVLIVDRHGTIKAGFTACFPRGCKLHLSSSPGVGVSRDMRLTWLIYIGVRKDCQQTIRKNFRSPPGYSKAGVETVRSDTCSVCSVFPQTVQVRFHRLVTLAGT